MRSWILKYRSESLILALFAGIYCSISLVNHYNFRTYSFDLGMFNHALYSFSHGKMNYFTLDSWGNNANYLADHFSPITFLYVPAYYIFGTWTLLIIQLLCILVGAWGCYKIAEFKGLDLFKRRLVLVLYLSQWGIFSALAFDFHNNVVAAMLVPWFILFYYQNEKRKCLMIFLLLLISKENISLWVAFILLGLMLEKGFRYFISQFKEYIKFEIPLTILALTYFYIVVSILMPYLSQGEVLSQLAKFGSLGSSFSEIASSIFSRPIDSFKMLFESNSSDPMTIGIKKELHLMVLFSGGIAFILNPSYLLMLLPIYIQKMFSDNTAIWGISGQYSIEFVPIICLSVIDLGSKIKRNWMANFFILIVTFSTIVATHKTLNHRVAMWYDPIPANFLMKEHYTSGGLDVRFIHEELEKIPSEIPLSVSSCLAPHLANRDNLYSFPNIKNAEMIVLIKNKRTLYPLSKEEFDELITKIESSNEYRVKLDQKNLLIFEKI